MWDVSQRTLRLTLDLPGDVWSLALSPDGETVVAGVADRTVRVWNLLSGQEIAVFDQHNKTVRRVAVHPSHPLTASATSDDVRIWDSTTLLQLNQLDGFNNAVTAMDFSPDGRSLALAHVGDPKVRLWEIIRLQETATFAHAANDEILDIEYSPDGRFLLIAVRQLGVHVWDTLLGRQVGSVPENASALAYSPDGVTLGVLHSDGAVSLWNMDQVRKVGSFGSAHRHLRSRSPRIDISSDGRLLASAGDSGAVRLSDIVTKKEVALLNGHTGYVWDVKFNPDARILASGSEDRTVRLWDVLERNQTFEVHTDGPVFSLDFSPSGRLLAYVDNQTVSLWDIKAMRKMANFDHPGAQIVSFSPDGGQVATGSNDGTVLIWPILAQFDNSTAVASSSGLSEVKLPQNTALLPPYPNPSNSRVSLPFHLATTREVTLDIYNSLGQRVRTLELGNLSAGQYVTASRAAQWDGNSDSGRPVASGVYLYLLRSADLARPSKIVLVR